MTVLTIDQALQPDWVCRLWVDESNPYVVTVGTVAELEVGADTVAVARVRWLGDGLEVDSLRVEHLEPIARLPGLHEQVRDNAEGLWQAGREHGAMEEREGHEVMR